MQPIKYNKELVSSALELLDRGYSRREAAKYLGVARSTLLDHLRVYYAEQEQEVPEEPTGARILVFDLETSCAIAAVFGRWKQNIGQANIVSEGGHILCAGYKWLGEEQTYLVHINGQSLFDIDDLLVVAFLWELFNEASAVVAHNAKSFDFPMLQARVLYHGLPPLPSVKVLDTLVMAKKNYRLPNNRLDSIAAFLGLDRKGDSGGIETWLKYMSGDAEAIQTMHDYCVQDVHVLEQVYLRLRGFGHAGSEYNAAHYYDDDVPRCHVCGSSDIAITGRSVYTAVSEFAEMRCNHCHAIGRARKALNNKTKRSSIIVQPKA